MDKDYKIVLVEDEPELAEMFSSILTYSGFKQVFHAIDGKSAIDLIGKVKPDLVLLDLVIPDVDGYEVLKKIKSDPKLSKSLVYVWSNLTQKDEVEKAKKLGADGYLVKSDYTPNKLAEKVKDILKLENK